MSIVESLFVIGVVFKNSFIIKNFYDLIPILNVNNYIYNKGDKISFFGVENSFASIIPKISNKNDPQLPIRGIRKSANSGKKSVSFGNSVAMDFQTAGKNYHMKVSSSKKKESKIHITGLTNYNSVKIVTQNFINQLKLIENAWVPFFKLSFESKVGLINCITNLVFTKDGVRRLDDPEIKNWLLSFNDEQKLFIPCIQIILGFILEDLTIEKFHERANRICHLDPGPKSVFHSDDDYNFVMFDIYNGSYTGNIGYSDLYFIHIVRKLAEMGYHVGFANIGKTEMRIMIEITNEEHYNDGSKAKESKGHLFLIKPGGSVSLFSKGDPEETIAIGKYIINLIRSFIESPEYNAEKNGLYYDSNFSNIEPLKQEEINSMVPTSNNTFDNLMNEYIFESEI